jgi:hypothetical protein
MQSVYERRCEGSMKARLIGLPGGFMPTSIRDGRIIHLGVAIVTRRALGRIGEAAERRAGLTPASPR